MQKKKSEDGYIFLQDSVTIEQATSLKNQLLDSIKKYKIVKIDISNVTDIDSSIVQLILSAKQEALKHKKDLFVVGVVQDSLKDFFSTLSISLPEQSLEV